MDFAVILENVWKLLNLRTGDAEEGFFHLISFIDRTLASQNRLIQRICREENIAYWDTLVDRAGMLFLRMRPQYNNLRVKLGSLSGDEVYPYLHASLKYNLSICNTQLVRELKDKLNPERLENDDGLPDLKQYEGIRRPAKDFQTLEELIREELLLQQARQISRQLLADWQTRHLNALCHYFEVFMGIQTQRLSRERSANIDQLHSRMRKKFLGYTADRGWEKEVVRLFTAMELENFCQQVPVAATYRNDGGEHDTPIE